MAVFASTAPAWVTYRDDIPKTRRGRNVFQWPAITEKTLAYGRLGKALTVLRRECDIQMLG